MKSGPGALGIALKEFGIAKHENWSDALGTVVNESGSVKHENRI
jgi:hypothetical protein